MKSRYPLIVTLFIGIVSFIVLDAVHNGADSHTSGAPAMRTGSPGDGGNTCRNCHSGPNPTTEAGLITSTIPLAGYSPGQTYTITATITRSGHTKFGFEISPQNLVGTKLGTLIVTNSAEMQLVGTGKYITHKSAGVTGAGSRSWNFDWTAPVAGTGDVTFYGAFNITNAMNNSSGDTVILSTLTVSECAAPAQPGSISGPEVLCVAGGTETYSIPPVVGAISYNWTFPGGWTMIGPSSESVQVLTTSSTGNILVTVSNACGTSQASTLAVTFDQISVTASATDVSCNGSADGSATAAVVSGIGNYDYLWSPGGQTTVTANNLGAGNYTVTVTDDAGCTATTSVAVNEPAALQLNSFSTTANCGGSDGTAGVIANGGTPQYSYLWNSIPPQTTSIAVNLPAGNYTVTVTDQNGCTATASESVSTIGGPVATAMNLSDASCYDANDGEAVVSVASGTPPYTYQWIPSGGNDSTAHNLHAGAYAVVVTDANGCTSTANVVIAEPSQIILNTSTTDAGCGQSNGSASVVANGGAGGYTYLWNSVPVQTTNVATNLPAGSYLITVTDSTGCSVSETVGVSDISGPTLQPWTITNVTCFGGNDGELSVIATGGTGPYSYDWFPSGGNDTLAKNLHAGAYSVTVTDALGCVSVMTGTITEPAELIAQPGPDVMLCIGESATLGVSPVASGGVSGYSYLWSPPTGLSSVTDSMPLASPATTTDYMLLVIDANGCHDSEYVAVTVNPLPVTPVVTANSDSLFSTPASGYQWYLDGNIITGATSQFFEPLQTGNYSVVITDQNGCTAVSADYFFDISSAGSGIYDVSFSVYPNPVDKNLFVRLSKDDEIELHISGITGERIISRLPSTAANFYTLDVSDLVRGVYILEMVSLTENKISRKIFIKE